MDYAKKGGKPCTHKTQERQGMGQGPDRLWIIKNGSKEFHLPYKWEYGFKLLGVVFDCDWNVRQHYRGARGEVINRVSGAVWGFGSRIFPVSSPALLESVPSYGLAATGVRVNLIVLRQVGTQIIRRVARKIVGANVTLRL